MNIKWTKKSRYDLDRLRGVCLDSQASNAYQAICDIIANVLETREVEERQEAFDAVFDMLMKDVAFTMDEEPKPNMMVEDVEQMGKEFKNICVTLDSGEKHYIKVFGDALFVNDEQIGGV